MKYPDKLMSFLYRPITRTLYSYQQLKSKQQPMTFWILHTFSFLSGLIVTIPFAIVAATVLLWYIVENTRTK